MGSAAPPVRNPVRNLRPEHACPEPFARACASTDAHNGPGQCVPDTGSIRTRTPVKSTTYTLCPGPFSFKVKKEKKRTIITTRTEFGQNGQMVPVREGIRHGFAENTGWLCFLAMGDRTSAASTGRLHCHLQPWRRSAGYDVFRAGWARLHRAVSNALKRMTQGLTPFICALVKTDPARLAVASIPKLAAKYGIPEAWASFYLGAAK